MAVRLIAADAWDTYGTPSSISTGTFGIYQANPNGATLGVLAINSIANPPWNPNFSGHYLHTVPGSVTIPNAGTGMYCNFGNPFRALLIGFWFRAASFSGGSSGGPFIFRWNVPSGQAFGADIATLTVDSSGHIGCNAGFTSNALSINTWYFIECYTLFGTSGSPTIQGAQAINVNSTSWISASNISIGSSGVGYAVPSFNFDNEFSGSNFDFGPWYLLGDVSGIGDALSTGGNLFFNTYLPTNNDVVQLTPNTGTNFSNVNSTPAGGNYNSSNVQGQQDTYGFSIPTLGTIKGVALSTSAEANPIAGNRVSLPVWKNGVGTVVTGSIGTGGGLSTIYSVAQDGRLVSPFTSLPFTAVELTTMKAGIVVQD
jgi:hypothetical protein